MTAAATDALDACDTADVTQPMTSVCASSSGQAHVVTLHWLARIVLGAFLLLILIACIPAMTKGGAILGAGAVLYLVKTARTTWLRISSTTVEVWTCWPCCRRVLAHSVARTRCRRVVSDGGIAVHTDDGELCLPGWVNGERAAALLGLPLEVIESSD
jgi:hypothetical protein